MAHAERIQCTSIHVHVVRVPPRQLGKVIALGVLCCCLFVCLTLLASFFLLSHLSLKNVHVHVMEIVYMYILHAFAAA